MNLTLLGKAFWLTGFLGQLLLLGILVGCGRMQRFPFFTAFIAFGTVQTVINFFVYRLGSPLAYFWTYWTLVILDALLQLAVVYEMAREVLRPTGTWSRDARTLFFALGLGGAILASALSFAVHPRATIGLFAWFIRLDLFTSLLIAELVIAMFIAARWVGLQWRNYVMGMAEGLGLWVCISLCVETAHSYWGWTNQYVTLDYVRMAAYVAALVYWCINFLRNEPGREPLPANLQKYLEAIGHSLEYDLLATGRKRKK